MKKLLTTSLGGVWALLLIALLSIQVPNLHAQQNQLISNHYLAHFRVKDDRACTDLNINSASSALLQAAYDLETSKSSSPVVQRLKSWHVPVDQDLVLEKDLFVFSEGNVRIDGNILGKSTLNHNSDGQNLIICSNGTIEINGTIQLSNGGNGQLPAPNTLAQYSLPQKNWAQIAANAPYLLPTVKLAQHVNGGKGGGLLLKARRIIINGQVKVGAGGHGIAGGNGGAGASLIFLFEQFQAGPQSRHFEAGQGGDGGDGVEWFTIDGGAGGPGGEALFFACSNGSNGANGTGSPTTAGTNGDNGGAGGNSTDGIACNGGNGGNGGSGGANNNLMSMNYGNGRRGGAGGNGGAGGFAFNNVAGGSSLGGDGGNGGSGGSGGNAFGTDNDGGRGGDGGDGGAGGAAMGAAGTNGNCATTDGGDATGGDGGDGGMGGFGGFGTGTGTGGRGGNGGARGPGGDGIGGSAGSCTAVSCSTPQGGTGVGGIRGARGTGGIGGPSGVGGTTGANGSLGPNNPSGTGTDGNDGVCILPIELTQFAANLREGGVLINWTTATELNNDYMALERSADAQNFLEIARIKGKGTTDETQHYAYFDPNPLAGINYYRLRQVDFDGTTDYSKVVAVTLDKGELMSIFPNPAKDRINIQTSLTLLPQEVYLLDALGRRVAVNLQGSPGWYEINLPVELPAGNYWLRLQDRAQIHRLVVVKE